MVQKIETQTKFTTLAEIGKPSTARKKPRKGISKKVSQQIQTSICDADDVDFTSRIRDEETGGKILSASLLMFDQALDYTSSPPPLIPSIQGATRSIPAGVAL